MTPIELFGNPGYKELNYQVISFSSFCSFFLTFVSPPEPATGELTQALLLVNSSAAGVETYNNNAEKYNDSLCEVGGVRCKSVNQVKFKVNCDPWTEEGVYQGSYTLKEVMILTHNQLGLKLGKLKDNKFFL